MAKAEASVEELVAMIQRGELRLPEMQRRYVWRATRVRDLLDSPGKRFHPVPPEQVVGQVLAHAGRDMSHGWFSDLERACGESGQAQRYALSVMGWLSSSLDSDYLGRAIIPALVAAFEDLLASLLRLWLTKYPDAMEVGSRQITTAEAASYRSGDDLFRRAVDERVSAVVDEGPERWQKVLSKHLRIDLQDVTRDWPRFREILLRRNVLIHTGGRADQTYLDRLPSGIERPTLGGFLNCGEAYLTEALGVVEALGVCLAVVWSAQLAPGAAAAQLAHEPVFEALKAQRWTEARAMASRALKGPGIGPEHDALRVNLWMARQEAGDDPEEVAAEVRAWTPAEDDERLALGREALLYDERAVLRSLERLRKDDPSTFQSAIDWPVIRRFAERSPGVARTVHLGSASRSLARRQAGSQSRRRT